MPSHTNAEILAEAPQLVATALRRGWARKGGALKLTPPPASAPSAPVPPPDPFALVKLDARFPSVAVRTREDGEGTWRATAETGEKAWYPHDARNAVRRVALRVFAACAADRRLPAVDPNRILIAELGNRLWMVAVRAGE